MSTNYIQFLLYILGRNPAVTLASTALIFTLYQAYLTRRHNQLSVRPSISHNKGRTDDLKRHLSSWIISIKNHGLGPAKILAIFLTYNGKLELTDSLTQMERHLSETFNEIEILFSGKSIPKGSFLSADEEHIIIDIQYVQGNDEEKLKIDKLFNNYSIYIVYRDLYDNRYVYKPGSKLSFWEWQFVWRLTSKPGKLLFPVS